VLRIEAQRQARQSPLYFDLTISWSKDISIFHASLGAAVQRARDHGDKNAEAQAAGLLAEVDQILRESNNAALAYLQREAGYVRTCSHVARVDGRESGQWREADLIVASWYQHTSRDGDMQLHEHNQIAHVAITRDDGKGRAPDSTAYYEHVRAAGQIASVHAEAALTRRFGMTWVPRADGMGFGIDGIGTELMAVFSHRRAEITKLVDQELVPRFKAEHGRAPNQRELEHRGLGLPGLGQLRDHRGRQARPGAQELAQRRGEVTAGQPVQVQQRQHRPWCPSAEYVFLGPGGGHFRRSNYSERFFRPAADGWYLPRQGKRQRAAVPVLVSQPSLFPGRPVPPWPAAIPGETFTPPAGRGLVRLVSDQHTGRCPACDRAWPRRTDRTDGPRDARNARCLRACKSGYAGRPASRSATAMGSITA